MNSPVDEIKNKLDVVELIQSYIRLQKTGRNYRALCPFHSEKTPSFSVSPERQMWYCFGCSRGGSVFDFVMQMEGVEFGEALRILAQRAGVELKKIDPQLSKKQQTEKSRLYEICELAARFFEKQLEAGKTGQLVKNYLYERGLKPESIRNWRLGYTPDKWQALSDFLGSRGYGEEIIFKAGLSVKRNEGQDANFYDRFRNRIMFPIFDLNGAVIGFSGRIFGEAVAGGPVCNAMRSIAGRPKYLNTSNTLIYDKSKVLYGLDRAKLDIRKEDLCVLVEGQMDVIMSHQAGVKNAAAASGTALTQEHLRVVKRYTENLATAFDMDKAGEAATKRGIDLAVASGFNVKIIKMPADKDPADCVKDEPSFWPRLIEKSESIIEFYFSSAFSRFNPNLADGKKEIGKILLPVLKEIPNKIEQAHWIQELGRRIAIEEKVLVEEMKKIKTKEPEAVFNSFGDYFKEGLDVSAANKKNQLEEYLLSILVAYPELIENFKKQPSYLFFDEDLAKIFKKLKKSPHYFLEIKGPSMPADLISRIRRLIFEIEEAGQKENFNPQKEAEFCFSQLKKHYFQQKLDRLNLDIKKAENLSVNGEKNKPILKRLTEEFNKLSRQMVADN